MPMNRIQFQPGLSRPAFLSSSAPKRNAKRRWSGHAGPTGFAVLVAGTPMITSSMSERIGPFSARRAARKPRGSRAPCARALIWR